MHKHRTIHGIDPYAPGGIEALLEHHRATFGSATMMADEGGSEGAGGDSGGSGEGEGQQEKQESGEGQQETKGANLWDDPAKAKAEIERLRAENGKDRTTAKTKAAEDARNELTQSIGKALGLIKDGDTKPDPAELTKQIGALSTEATQAKTELAVYKAASKAGADADALLDSRGFLAKLTDIDPTDSKAITKAIDEAVKDNPKLKLVRAAGTSGADFTGGTGEQRQTNVAPGRPRLAAAFNNS
jgi:hypothetical protein